MAGVYYHLGRAIAKQTPPDRHGTARTALEQARAVLRRLPVPVGGALSPEQAALLADIESTLSKLEE